MKYLTLLLALLLLAGCATPARELAVTNPPAAAEAPQWGRTVERNGHVWRYNTRLKTILFLGIDSTEVREEHGYIGTGGRSDTMLLLVLNQDRGITEQIWISRDTMANVDIYNRDREKIADGFMQITMQYAFGDNPKRSCLLSKKAVSEMLLDLPIDYYCSMTLDGITAAVSQLGGLTVTLQEDCTDISPDYTKGSVVTMDARMTERFLRYRDVETSGSNLERIERQNWFVREMLSSLLYSGSVSTRKLLNIVEPYLETDMDAETIEILSQLPLADNPRMIPGEVVQGARHEEFYIDEEALKDLLLDAFYYRVS